MNNHPLVGRYLDVLTERLGWTVEAVDAANGLTYIRFGCGSDDLRCVIELDPLNDPSVIEVSTGFDKESFELTALQLGEVMNEVNARCKGIKAFQIPDLVLLSTQMVVAPRDAMPTADHLVAVLPRIDSMMRHAIAKLAESAQLAPLESDAFGSADA